MTISNAGYGRVIVDLNIIGRVQIMQMTKEEIIKNYKEAKAPSKQIGILAQLNCCDTAEIREILKEAGVLRKYERKGNTEPVKVESKPATKLAAPKTLKIQEDKKVPGQVAKLIESRLSEIDKEIAYHQDKIAGLKTEADDLRRYLCQ